MFFFERNLISDTTSVLNLKIGVVLFLIQQLNISSQKFEMCLFFPYKQLGFSVENLQVALLVINNLYCNHKK